jgi:hypothetical protein
LQPLILNIFSAKIVFKLLSVSFKLFLFVILCIFNSLLLNAAGSNAISDTNNIESAVDKIIILSDSTLSDSLLITDSTSIVIKAKKKDVLEDKVTYSAEDSMIISITGQILYLYGNANVKYTDIELTSNYIMLDLSRKEVFAKGLTDTAGNVSGTPVFKQGSESFESDSMKYNFDTKKGIIYNIITKQGEGYFHSEKTKRLANEHIHAMKNKYTTCDAKHPHFYLALNKALVIPEDKIVSGSAYLVVQDVPLPLFIPFGFFPNTTRRSSGILIPTYENDATRGVGLRQGGWYQVLNDYADLTVLVNYYSRGSWGLNSTLTYRWKYHFGGSFTFDYNLNKLNDEVGSMPLKDYAIRWNHSQDSKSSPNQSFSAGVNFSSRENDRRNSYSYQEYTQNTTNSSINYSRNWPKSGANLSLSASATQNKATNITNVNLPTGSFNIGTKYPFRKEGGSGKYKWYENISISYRSQFRNDVTTYDSLLFKNEVFSKMENGFKHEIPVAVNFKIGKMITLGPSFTYTGMAYSRHINKTVEYVNDTIHEYFDTIPSLAYIHAINPSAGISFTPKIYGMFVSKRDDSYIKAVRHVMSPSASFSFTPDMREVNPNYYDVFHFTNDTGALIYNEVYSEYNKEPYGVPSSYGKSGSLRLALNNNLEMKVMPKNDTTGKPKKVVLLDNLNFASGYNPFRETFKWDPVSFSTGTRIFKNKLDIRVNGSLDPYAIDSVGRRIDKYYNHKSGLLFRLTNISVSSGFTLQSEQGKKGKSDTADDETEQPKEENDARIDESNEMDFVPGTTSGGYVDFDIPWSLRVSYSWSYSKSGLEKSVSHTVNFSGDLNITKNWKIGFSSGYDIKEKDMIFTSLNFYRDLHCWEMSFGVVPFGERRSYSFNIHAKSSLLQDLKYDLKPNTWYDKF